MHVMGTCGVISHHDGLMDSMHDRGSRHLSMVESWSLHSNSSCNSLWPVVYPHQRFLVGSKNDAFFQPKFITEAMSEASNPPPEWTIIYHGQVSFKGRGEFLRLMLEDKGVPYVNSAKNLYGPIGIMDCFRGDAKAVASLDDTPFPVFFPPAIWHRPPNGIKFPHVWFILEKFLVTLQLLLPNAVVRKASWRMQSTTLRKDVVRSILSRIACLITNRKKKAIDFPRNLQPRGCSCG